MNRHLSFLLHCLQQANLKKIVQPVLFRGTQVSDVVRQTVSQTHDDIGGYGDGDLAVGGGSLERWLVGVVFECV